MKAVLVRQPGGPDALEYIDVPRPAIGPGDIEIRAEAFGVGQPDVLIRRGVYRWMPPLPANPGNDVGGRVTASGSKVRNVTIGQKVLLSARDLPQRGGCYAEFVVAPAEAVHLLPESVDFEQAVCLANYQVAWALLHKCGSVHRTDSALVIGAAGGVGTALVQLGKLAGIKIIGTVSSEEKAEFARRNGADDVIFYRSEDVVQRTRELTAGKGVGLLFDHIGGPGLVRHVEALESWGTLVSYGALAGLPQENLLAAMRNHAEACPAIRVFSFHIFDRDKEERRSIMLEVIDALSRRAITPSISARFKLSEVRQAHALLESGGAMGKIVMTP